MKKIQFDYQVLRDGEVIVEGFAEAGIPDKSVTKVIDFIKEHPTGELVDLPSDIYDRFNNAAYEDSIQCLKEEGDALYGTDEVQLQTYLPFDLVELLPKDVKELLPDEVYESMCDDCELMPDNEGMKYDQENDRWVFFGEEEQTKENILYLTIKQSFFDEIIAGTKKEEFREIKETTFKKYLDCDEHGMPYFDDILIDVDDPLNGDICIYNNGVYPYIPSQKLRYLNLAVGYQKERDTAIVELDGVSFRTAGSFAGENLRFDEDENGELYMDEDGRFCYWVAVLHIKRVVSVERKKK